MKKIILGSTSPRRKEILDFFSLPYEIIPSPFDERKEPIFSPFQDYIQTLARKKGEALKELHPDALIITCDTMVLLDNKLLGKPENEQASVDMLLSLSGRWHTVYTAVHIETQEKSVGGIEKTQVHCNTITPFEAHHYLKAHLLLDKAGSYAIQKSGSLLVKEISGCYYNVMGLPINLLRTLLLQFDIDLWNYLQPF